MIQTRPVYVVIAVPEMLNGIGSIVAAAALL